MKKLKYISLFENFGQPSSSVISKLKSGELFTTKDWKDLAPLYLAVQQDRSGNLTAVTTSESPSELSGMMFTYSCTVYSPQNIIYMLKRI
jgi:hypothetical protein